MTLPNFLIISGGRSGTTSLYHYLEQHPAIFMCPVKEPHFFCFEGESLDFRGPRDELIMRRFVTNIEDYLALFQGATNEKAVGEASTHYLYSQKAVERIKHYIQNVKLIAILRHPAERAYSAFLLSRREGYDPIRDFTKALEEEEARIHNKWFWGHYLTKGYYYIHLKRYFDNFDRDQIRVYLYEDLKADALGLVQDIFRFLNVDNTFAPDVSKRYNPTGSVPRSRTFQAFLTEPHPIKALFKVLLPEGLRGRIRTGLENRNRARPLQLSPEMRKQLTEVYQEDILKLQTLIQRDLSEWLE